MPSKGRERMGASHGLFNHTKKEYALPGMLPVDRAAPTTYSYAALIAHPLTESWRYDHAAIMGDPKDFDCHRRFGSKYEDLSIEPWNEFATMMGWQFMGLGTV